MKIFYDYNEQETASDFEEAVNYEIMEWAVKNKRDHLPTEQMVQEFWDEKL